MEKNLLKIAAEKARIEELKEEISTLEKEPKTKAFEELDEFRQNARMQQIRIRINNLNWEIGQAETRIKRYKTPGDFVDKIVDLL